MVTPEDVQEGIVTLWNGDATLQSLVTDPLVEGLTADPASVQIVAPYVEFQVTAGQPTYTARLPYLQLFDLRFRSYSEAGSVPLGTLQQAIENAFSRSFAQTGTRQIALPSGRTLTVLMCWKRSPGGIDEDQDTQEASSVKYSDDHYEMLCQG